MMNWFKKRRAKKEIEKFERALSDKLGDIFPAMKLIIMMTCPMF
jgi:hypothetical protein